jgi:NAD+ kinase
MGREAPVLGLVMHPRNDVRASVATIVGLARRHGARVVARAGDLDRAGEGVEALDDADFAELTDILISLGGDGTMLGAMRLVAGRPTPVLGVNHGTIGFLIETSPAELPEALGRLIDGKFSLEPHSCLESPFGVAFNDAVLAAAQPWTAVTLDLAINELRHGYFRCDALVACTPTGSTAYSYAAGGPIISPSAPVIGLTPVAPMSGIGRSIVLGGDEVITLRSPADRPPARITLDGAESHEIEPGRAVTLRLRPAAVNVVRFDSDTHNRRARVKLSLLDLPLRPDQLIELVPEHLRERVRTARGGLLSE